MKHETRQTTGQKRCNAASGMVANLLSLQITRDHHPGLSRSTTALSGSCIHGSDPKKCGRSRVGEAGYEGSKGCEATARLCFYSVWAGKTPEGLNTTVALWKDPSSLQLLPAVWSRDPKAAGTESERLVRRRRQPRYQELLGPWGDLPGEKWFLLCW